jgi:DnaJ domain
MEKNMNIQAAIQSMNLNQLEALFQTSISIEFGNLGFGKSCFKFEGYNGKIGFKELVERIMLAFQEDMGPVQKEWSLKKIALCRNSIDSTQKLIEKVETLHKKVLKKKDLLIPQKIKRTTHHIKKLIISHFNPRSTFEICKWKSNLYDLGQELILNISSLEAEKQKLERKVLEEEFLRKKAAQNKRRTYEQQFYTDYSDFLNFIFGFPGFIPAFEDLNQDTSSPQQDPYEVMGLERDSSQEEIKKKFYKLARLNHPDKNPNDPSAKQKFQELKEAYSILEDPKKRSQFDRFGKVFSEN